MRRGNYEQFMGIRTPGRPLLVAADQRKSMLAEWSRCTSLLVFLRWGGRLAGEVVSFSSCGHQLIVTRVEQRR